MNLIPRSSLFDHWFDKDFPGFRLMPEAQNEYGRLAVDIHETDKAYTLKADFPGLRKEDISVSVDNGVLTLSAEHKEEKTEKEEGRVVRQERRYGSYMRSFTLGSDVDEKNIKASFADGVLALEIPKTKGKTPQSTHIPIQ